MSERRPNANAPTALTAAAVSLSAAAEGTSGRCFNVCFASRGGGGGGGVRTLWPVSTRALTVCHVAAGLSGLMRLREVLPDATGESTTGFAPPPADFALDPQTATLDLAGRIDLTSCLGSLGELACSAREASLGPCAPPPRPRLVIRRKSLLMSMT